MWILFNFFTNSGLFLPFFQVLLSTRFRNEKQAKRLGICESIPHIHTNLLFQYSHSNTPRYFLGRLLSKMKARYNSTATRSLQGPEQRIRRDFWEALTQPFVLTTTSSVMRLLRRRASTAASRSQTPLPAEALQSCAESMRSQTNVAHSATNAPSAQCTLPRLRPRPPM